MVTKMETNGGIKVWFSTVFIAIVYFSPRFARAETEKDVVDVCTMRGFSCARHRAFDDDFQCCEGLYCKSSFWYGTKTCEVDENYVSTTTTPKPSCGTDRESCSVVRRCCETLKCIGPRQARICSDTSHRGPRKPSPQEP